jgi:hypothetical protein
MMQKLRVCSIAMRRQYAGARWSGQFTARGVTAPESVALSKVVGYNLIGRDNYG